MPAVSAAVLALAASANVTLTAITPSAASILGGTTLTLTGTGFVGAAAAEGSAAASAAALCKMSWNWGGWAFNSTTYEPRPAPMLSCILFLTPSASL